MAQRKVKLVVAYDGSPYHGWQRQEDGIITVQEVLEQALQRACQHPVTTRGSGRTDTGVHAAGQVVTFRTDTRIPTEKLPHAVNSRLPNDIRIRSAVDVCDEFDPISSAVSKLYRYTVYNGPNLPPCADKYCYHYYIPTDIAPMQRAALLLLGEKDFASFASAGSVRQTTVRTMLRCEVTRAHRWLYFDLESNGFLYHMVRNVVGTLLEVGRGHWPPEKINDILAAQSRTAAGPMVPPNGLSLQWVKYPPVQE